MQTTWTILRAFWGRLPLPPLGDFLKNLSPLFFFFFFYFLFRVLLCSRRRNHHLYSSDHNHGYGKNRGHRQGKRINPSSPSQEILRLVIGCISGDSISGKNRPDNKNGEYN